jgi:hypothetical protein
MLNLDELTKNPLQLTEGRSYKQVLEDSYFLIYPEERWTQGCHARDKRGEGVKPGSTDAVCWCLLGSVARSSNRFALIPGPLLTFLEEMCVHLYQDRFQSVGALNDYLDHESVLVFLKACINQLS